ncbi:hypothetical protein M413DRAFT_26594 [Hebeloma cylindrosporum]|uniref:Uncharacterized protein n=1 Tax=Hebeloma cylindrosporum TaxID=76867 RepID=A0A0C3CEB4_HEBCY|nr:hypothetical protein M413DRAFT_26594 [Hebeloma cylindrosporum h7]
MLHFYDSSPYWHVDVQRARLKPASALSDSRIKCLIWGEDLLAYIHFIPTNLFDLHLVVQYQDVQRASTEIMQSLPYEICSVPPPHHLESIFSDPDQPKSFPHSVLLEMTIPDEKRHMDDAGLVFIHPQCQIYLDVNDTSRSVSLPPFPDTIRFPTRTASLDSMIELCLDPPTGRIHTERDGMISVWISYFLSYTLRNEPRALPNDDLEREHAEVVHSLKPENQPFLENRIRGGTRDTILLAKGRREILEKLGKYEEARRPLVQHGPGNPQFWAERRARRKLQEEQALANQK